MKELQKMQEYLSKLKFHIDYQYENEQVWISYHRGETIDVDTDKKTVIISQPFDADVVVTTLEDLKNELN